VKHKKQQEQFISLANFMITEKFISSQWAKSKIHQLIRHSKYSTMLPKMHSHRLLFRRFCPLGSVYLKNIVAD